MPEAVSDPHIQARKTIVELEHPGIGNVPLIQLPIRLSETPGEIRTPAPLLGQHNEEVYCKLLGLSSEQFSQLVEEDVV
jgi:crotonobetainyl-CoA:carnitine CoA-transferase CaiB-like acyl-CoA transferase